MNTHALTVDLEDWHQLVHRSLVGDLLPASADVVRDTNRILDILDDCSARATFFVVGMVAEAYPQLVQEVARRGHEIGSHTYSHQLVFRQRPEAFKEDVKRSRRQLQDLTGQAVLGFRAPEFSVQRLDHWCFTLLADAGYRYDSSVFPTVRARYGIPKAPRQPFAIRTTAGDITEFPLFTWQIGSAVLPFAGGSYLRFLPATLLNRALSHSNGPAVMYVHPYEFHRGLLYLPHLSIWETIRPRAMRHLLLHNFATDRIVPRLRAVLARHHFAPLGEMYDRRELIPGSRTDPL
jgi:polysaccharide deacetylase family protein (PEP-CTERM system associated)